MIYLFTGCILKILDNQILIYSRAMGLLFINFRLDFGILNDVLWSFYFNAFWYYGVKVYGLEFQFLNGSNPMYLMALFSGFLLATKDRLISMLTTLKSWGTPSSSTWIICIEEFDNSTTWRDGRDFYSLPQYTHAQDFAFLYSKTIARSSTF